MSMPTILLLVLALLVSPGGLRATPPEALVCGRVTAPAGSPVPQGTRVELLGSPTGEAATAAVGADGRFCFAAPGAGRHLATVRAPGFVAMSRPFDARTGDAVELPPVTLARDVGVLLEIRSAEDEPLADAELRAQPPAASGEGWQTAPRSGRTDAGGRLTLPRAAGEALDLFASAGDSIHLVVPLPDPDPPRPPGFVTAPLPRADAAGSGTGEPPHALLPAGRPAFGLLLDERRRPLAGAEVILRESGGAAAATARTGSDGRFLVAAVPAPRFDLRAHAPGFAPAELPGMTLRPGGGAADLGTLELQPGVRVEGRVTDLAGAPIARAEVRHREVSGLPGRQQRDRLLESPPAAVSGPDGEFVIADLPAGHPLHLLSSADGFLPTWTLGVETPPEEPVAIALQRAAAVAGTVVDEEGEPVTGGRVLLRWPGPPSGTVGVERRRGDGSRRAEAEADGAFRFETLEPGTVELSAESDEHLPSEPVEVELAPGEDRSGVRLVVRPGAVIRGRALDATGEPVAGAEVRAGPTTARSGADGSFRLAGLEPGFVGLFGFHPDYRRTVEEVEVVAGVNEQDLRFEDGYGLSGHTVDAAGEPIAGARVVVRQEALRELPGYGATSGRDGAFRVVVSEEGSFGLVATAPGYAPSVLSGLELGPAPVEGVEVVLSKGASIVGQIYGLEIDDLATVEVEAGAQGLGSVAGTVDYLGRYAVEHLVPGDWQVRARVAGGRREARATVPVEEADERVVRDLELGTGVALSGRVRYRGEPVAAAHVSLDGRDVAAHRSVVTGHDGGFRVEGLEPGSYRLDVLDPSRALSHLEEIAISADREIVLDLVSERLAGRVVDDETGAPIEDALVYVRGGADGSLVTVGTDADGGFLLAHVTPGSYRVSARKNGYTPDETTVRVEAGAETPPTLLRLAAAAGLTLTVRAGSGPPPGFVTVSAFDASGRKVHTDTKTVTDNGFAYFQQLPPGRWNLLVDAQGTAAEWVSAEVPGAAEVVLSPAALLSVRVPALMESGGAGTVTVVSASGESFFEVEPGGTLRDRWPLEDGLATVPDLPAGEWTVRVTSAAGEVWTAPAATDGVAPAQVSLE